MSDLCLRVLTAELTGLENEPNVISNFTDRRERWRLNLKANRAHRQVSQWGLILSSTRRALLINILISKRQQGTNLTVISTLRRRVKSLNSLNNVRLKNALSALRQSC